MGDRPVRGPVASEIPPLLLLPYLHDRVEQARSRCARAACVPRGSSHGPRAPACTADELLGAVFLAHRPAMSPGRCRPGTCHIRGSVCGARVGSVCCVARPSRRRVTQVH